ncbi:rhodanese-like domain-containing protein [Chloroflexota bacterium]
MAQRLMDQGLNNVSALLGGFAAWQREGLPVEATSQ